MITEKNSTIVILGLSDNEHRYSFLAYKMLLENEYKNLIGVTPKPITLSDIKVVKTLATIDQKIDTLTIYVGQTRIQPMIKEIIDAAPRRIIFNPETENRELIEKAKENEIEVVEGCTLVMLRTNQF